MRYKMNIYEKSHYLFIIADYGYSNSKHVITPKQQHCDSLEVDEFWTYVGNKGRVLN